MAQEIINVGAAPNDGQGDPIRTAFIKCNNNFTQLFSVYTTVPPTLFGNPGNFAGMYANDANFFYYCFADYTTGTTVIWAQISEVDTTSYISNGNTRVGIPTTNGNILFNVDGVANVVVMTTDGLEVDGNTSISKNITVSENADVGGNTSISKNITVSENADVGGNIDITGNAVINGYLSVVDESFLNNNTFISGNLSVLQKSAFNDNVVINGNLEVNGNITYVNVDDLRVTDPLIQLAANNSSSDSLDIGFYGEWNDGVFQYGGLARDATDGDWKLFGNVLPQPTTVVDFTNATYSNLVIGDLKSENIFNSGNVSITGNVDVTANVNANNATLSNNITVSGRATITGNITGSANLIVAGYANVTGNVNVTANVNANNATVTNNVVIGGNTTSGNISSLGNIDVTGNVNVTANVNANNATVTNNVLVGGNVTATGLVTSGLFWSNGSPIISNTGNLILNSITTTGNAIIGGNTTSGNIISLGNVDVTGNVNANNSTITSNLVIGGNTTSGNIASLGNISAVANISTGANINGGNGTFTTNVVVVGNTTSGNIASLGNIVAVGNVDTTANVNANNASITANITAGGNITGANLITSGNVVANNAVISNNVEVGGTMFVGNIIPAANVFYTLGNATRQWKDLWVSNATIYINSIPLTMANSSVLLWNTVPLISSITDQDLTSSGNVKAGNLIANGLFWGNGSAIVSATGNLSSNNIATTGNATIGGNIAAGNAALSGTVSVSGNVSSAGNIAGGNLITSGNVVAGNVVATTAEFGAIKAVGNVISSTDPNITIDPNSGGGTVGTVFILGNLQVAGNITTVNSNTVTIDSLLFQSANNAPNPAAADGGGLAVGPAGASYATWTFSSVANAWVSNLPISVQGANVNGSITNATTITANGAITTAAAVTGSTLVSTVATGTAPLTVASTTLVANLNANLLNGVSNTASNVINTIVSRDSNADFAANTITARSFTGVSLIASGNAQVNSLGVGTPASGVLGEIRAANNITGFYSSDSKFKENITDISEPADKVRAIGGKMFDWTDEYIQDRGGLDDYFLHKHDFGVIAQDVQQVFPEAVRVRPDGSLAVDYPKLSALAFAAINELSDRFSSEIAELRSEIAKLKGQ